MIRFKKIACCISFFLISIGMAAQISVDTNYCTDPKIDSILTFAFTCIGKRYRGGSMGPNSFDCSGFTCYVYNQVGYKLNRTSGSQIENGVEVSRENVQPGDLVFFKGRSTSSSRIGHVGMVTSSNKDGTFSFIHASCNLGVTESEITEKYYTSRYLKACRVINPHTAVLLANTPKVPVIPVVSKQSDALTTKPDEIIHIVEKGQTLYSISKKYGCTTQQLSEWNDLKESSLSIGQTLKINPTTISEATEVVCSENAPQSTTTHIVQKGETLFSIAQQYNCSVIEIFEWNKLNSEALSIGQEIFVYNPKKIGKSSSRTPSKN